MPLPVHQELSFGKGYRSFFRCTGRHRIMYGFIFVFLVSAWGCAASPKSGTREILTSYSIQKILILPFQDMTSEYGAGMELRCPLCGTVYTTGTVADGAAESMTTRLMTLLEAHSRYILIPPDESGGVVSGLLSEHPEELSELDLLVQTGREMGADAVLTGKLYRYMERVGTRFSVSSPASIGFALDLVHVAQRRVIWSGHFDETQKSLFENLFDISTFFRRGGVWLSAEQLSDAGLEQVLEVFYRK